MHCLFFKNVILKASANPLAKTAHFIYYFSALLIYLPIANKLFFISLSK